MRQPHIEKVMAVEWTLHWTGCLQFVVCVCWLRAWSALVQDSALPVHWVINLKLRFGSFKYSISCEIFRLHEQRHNARAYTYMSVCNVTMVTVDFCTFEEDLQHVFHAGNLLRVQT